MVYERNCASIVMLCGMVEDEEVRGVAWWRMGGMAWWRVRGEAWWRVRGVAWWRMGAWHGGG